MSYTHPEHHPTVVIASSDDEELRHLQAPLDADLTYEQVDAIVHRALDLDSSTHSLKSIIRQTDWVVIKPNIVTSRSNPDCSYWYNGVAHPGQVTDLRVIKSLVGYLIEHCQPRRITIAEGGAEWKKNGEPGTAPDQKEDGWTVHWPEFDNLSYRDIVATYDETHPDLVDIVDLNYDTIRFEPVPDPHSSGIHAMQYVGAVARPVDRFGREAYIPDTGQLREGYYIPETILTCDRLISVPAMKTHICGTTLAMKNYVGILPNHPSGLVRKHEVHQGEFQRGFIDLFAYHPADYSVIEGVWSTEGNGPQWGENLQHNVVIASADAVAADAVATLAMGFNPSDLDCFHYAAQKGFGTFDTDEMCIVGKPIQYVSRQFKRAAGRKGIGLATRGNRRWFIQADGRVEPTILESGERYIDLAKHFGTERVSSCVASVSVHSAYARKAELWAGADGKMRVELNDTEILRKETETGHQLAECQTDIELRVGSNSLSVWIERSVHGFGFTTLICDQFGAGLLEVEYALDD